MVEKELTFLRSHQILDLTYDLNYNLQGKITVFLQAMGFNLGATTVYRRSTSHEVTYL